MSRKKSLHRKKHKKTIVQTNYENETLDINFREYTGNNVTVYINAGGIAGNGITGVLVDCRDTYVTLLVVPKLQISCALDNKCRRDMNNLLNCMSCPYNRNAAPCTIAEIPMSGIVAIVHNKVTNACRK